MLETDDAILPSCGKETLLTKIQTVQEKLTVSAHVSKIALSLNSDRGMKQLPVCVKVDISTNTDEYDCHECSNRRKAAESTTDSECQTEEVTAVQFGLQDEIPMIFCQTLLNDGELQQKIAQTINEHMLDPHGEYYSKYINCINLIASRLNVCIFQVMKTWFRKYHQKLNLK